MHTILPGNYSEWHYCITQECGIVLTKDFIEKRLQALTDPQDAFTIEFTRLYGTTQLEHTIEWFKQAGTSLA